MTRASLASLVSTIPLALLAAACNPYDPDLGTAPFKCGMSAPLCPDGYTCTNPGAPSDGKRIAGGDIRPDASTAIVCNDDGALEPNDMPNRAFVTPIPSAGPKYSLLGLALCPMGDNDYFQFGVTTNGTNLDASVVSVAGRTPLQLNLLNATGTIVIATGLSDNATPQMVKLEISNLLAVGTYFLQVKSPDMAENNYDLVIKTCPREQPLPCPP